MSLALTLSHQVERGYGGSRLTTDLAVTATRLLMQPIAFPEHGNTAPAWRQIGECFRRGAAPHRETRSHDVAQSVGPCLRGVAGFVVL